MAALTHASLLAALQEEAAAPAAAPGAACAGVKAAEASPPNKRSAAAAQLEQQEREPNRPNAASADAAAAPAAAGQPGDAGGCGPQTAPARVPHPGCGVQGVPSAPQPAPPAADGLARIGEAGRRRQHRGKAATACAASPPACAPLLNLASVPTTQPCASACRRRDGVHALHQRARRCLHPAHAG